MTPSISSLRAPQELLYASSVAIPIEMSMLGEFQVGEHTRFGYSESYASGMQKLADNVARRIFSDPVDLWRSNSTEEAANELRRLLVRGNREMIAKLLSYYEQEEISYGQLASLFKQEQEECDSPISLQKSKVLIEMLIESEAISAQDLKNLLCETPDSGFAFLGHKYGYVDKNLMARLAGKLGAGLLKEFLCSINHEDVTPLHYENVLLSFLSLSKEFLEEIKFKQLLHTATDANGNDAFIEFKQLLHTEVDPNANTDFYGLDPHLSQEFLAILDLLFERLNRKEFMEFLGEFYLFELAAYLLLDGWILS